MKPETKLITELLADEFFVKWVLNPDKESSDYWKRWISQDPSREIALKKARELILSFKLREEVKVNEKDYNRMLDTLIQFNNSSKSNVSIHLQRKKSTFVKKLAIACSFFLIIGFLTWYLRGNRSTSVETHVELVTKSAGAGVKATIVLPDGSTVKLNSESEIQYPVTFSDSTRDVYLTGQGFFEVIRNPEYPFIVHTDHLTTTVLGTSFDINTFGEMGQHHVAVLTGKVKVETVSGISEILNKNEMIKYDDGSKTSFIMSYDYASVMGWKDGIISFNKASFKEVTETLSRWYGVQFEVSEGFEVKGNFTGNFENESMENVLMGISFSSEFNYKIEKDKVNIYP